MNSEENHIYADKIFKFSLGLLLLVIPVIVFFLWKSNFNIDSPIDHTKFGTFGDFMGGILGSIWGLAGVLLFYIALKDQKEDIRLNREALLKQIEALELQNNEFILQREELIETRKIFTEQSKTLKKQSFESTYFSLLDLYNKIVSEINTQSKSGNYFKQLRTEFSSSYTPNDACPLESFRKTKAQYAELFNSKKDDLSHYFQLLSQILMIVDEALIDEDEKHFYVRILRSQLSESEMFALYYNSYSEYSGLFYKLILRYNLLKALPSISKVEFKNCADQGNMTSIMSFSNLIFTKISEFLFEVDSLIKEDGFENHKISFDMPLLNDECIIAFSSIDQNQLAIKISTKTKSIRNSIFLGFNGNQFCYFFKIYLWDIFVFSTYSEANFTNKDITVDVDPLIDKHVLFSIISKKKLTFNTDYR